MNGIDSFLNRITMYRLVRNSLIALVVLSIVFAFIGWLPYTAFQLTVSATVLLISCVAMNSLGALFTKAAPTPESTIITALILFFILRPVHSPGDIVLLAAGAGLAMLSKYLLTWRKKHIFNPAAFGAFILSISGFSIVSWWVATPIMLPFVLAFGMLFVRKIHQFGLFWTFIITATVVFVLRSLLAGSMPLQAIITLFVSLPIIFFATVMVIEPQTMPSKDGNRVIYGAIIGFLFSVPFAFGVFSMTPELALLVGNVYAWLTSLNERLTLTFKKSTQLSREVYEYVFTSNKPLSFEAGQYVEWTIPHRKADQRGVRRYFSIASAPSDPFVRFGVRVPVERSTFKDHLVNLKPDEQISVANISGSFVLPQNPDVPVALVAGGIGITSFMSMFRELAAKRERRNIVLVYAAASPFDFAYKEEIDSIKHSIGLAVLYLPTDYTELAEWKGLSGYLTSEIVKKEIPDYQSRMWYLSGPEAMVRDYGWLLRTIKVPRKAVKKDYFPGF